MSLYNASWLFQAKVRARLSRPLSKPLQRGRGKHNNHGDFRSGRNSGRLARPSRGRPAPRSYPTRVVRGIGSRAPPVRPVSVRSRRPVPSMLDRVRPVAPPARTFERRLTGMNYIPIYTYVRVLPPLVSVSL